MEDNFVCVPGIRSNINDMKAEIEACRGKTGGCSSAEEKSIGQKYAEISKENDRVLAATCASVECVNSYLSQAVKHFSQTASELRDYSIDAFTTLHRQDAFLISPEAFDQIKRNIAFKDDYDKYVLAKCGGDTPECANNHFEEWNKVNDKLAIADKVKTVLSVAIGGGMAVGPKVVQTIKSCVSNPDCLSKVGITIVEAGAETIAGAPIAAPAGLTLAAGTLALQKGDEVVGLFEESVGYLSKIDGTDNAFWRAADGSLRKLDSAGELFNPVPGRVQSRINLAEEATQYTPLKENGEYAQAGWKHVKQGHIDNTNGQSKFTLSEAAVRELLQSNRVVDSPVSRVVEINGTPTYVRELDTGTTIGTIRQSQGGRLTTRLYLQTDEAGNLITAFPIP